MVLCSTESKSSSLWLFSSDCLAPVLIVDLLDGFCFVEEEKTFLAMLIVACNIDNMFYDLPFLGAMLFEGRKN